MKTPELENLISTVDEINWQIYDCFPNDDSGGNGSLGLYPRMVLEYVTELGWFIKFGDVLLWREDEDDRMFIEEKDEYEPLKPFLLEQMEKFLDTYGKIRANHQLIQ